MGFLVFMGEIVFLSLMIFYNWGFIQALAFTMAPVLLLPLLYRQYKERIILWITGMSDRWYWHYAVEKEAVLCPECGTPVEAHQTFDTDTRQLVTNKRCGVCGYGANDAFKVDRPNLGG